MEMIIDTMDTAGKPIEEEHPGQRLGTTSFRIGERKKRMPQRLRRLVCRGRRKQSKHGSWKPRKEKVLRKWNWSMFLRSYLR